MRRVSFFLSCLRANQVVGANQAISLSPDEKSVVKKTVEVTSFVFRGKQPKNVPTRQDQKEKSTSLERIFSPLAQSEGDQSDKEIIVAAEEDQTQDYLGAKDTEFLGKKNLLKVLELEKKGACVKDVIVGLKNLHEARGLTKHVDVVFMKEEKDELIEEKAFSLFLEENTSEGKSLVAIEKRSDESLVFLA